MTTWTGFAAGRARGPGLAARCAAGLLALLMVTAGCGGPGRAHAARNRATRTAAASAAATAETAAAAAANPPAPLLLPLDAYTLTGTQSSELYYLSLRFMQACMAGRGFRYLPELNPAEVTAGAKITAELESRQWGISDPAVAREYGYHLPPWTSGPGVPQPVGRMPAAEQRAYEPCRDQALRELAADGLIGGTQLVAVLQADSWNKAEGSPRIAAVFARWSACMSTHGFRYKGPLQAAEDAKLGNAKTGAPLPVTPDEIRTAATDIGCKQQTNLLRIADAVQAGIQDKLIRQHAAELARTKSQVQRQASELAMLAAKYGIPGPT
jgi:hypothetical protein